MNKNMAEENNNVDPTQSVGESTIENNNTSDPTQSVGESVVKNEDDFKIRYEDELKKNKELEKKMGIQSNEFGDLKIFIKDLTPFLDRLENQPEIIQAVMDGKITPELLKSVSEGKITTEEAKTVSDAHKTVKEKLGDKKYEGTSPEEIQKLVQNQVDKQVDKFKTEFSKEYSEKAELKNYEESLNKFIENTPDFAEYATDINKWFNKYPNQTNIEIAYKAVKGEILDNKMKELNEDDKAKAAKELAANAGGGASQSNTIKDDPDILDKLIAPTSNRNIL